ncbi:hypothetical protein [Mahella australiensis]|uniref:Uncharacterized protein n=1 Tax=Mahella australiensis (strain DSM 15567 / CIP 107919 / 50-1 BON) TaxID=697281 RepID=F3ZVD9_MAHA5|nr:hypothetical protein [Mahella australiensis]AEE95289.1 hypothetical protein Mahau_0066 [Mahella australiensis 50-1 BON]
MAGSEKVNKNIEAYVDRLIAASLALGQDWAGTLEAEMKEKAPWHDRTGHARQGLKGIPLIEKDEITIRLAHTMEYGVYLELAHDGKYAILKPTGEANAERIYKDFEDLWK